MEMFGQLKIFTYAHVGLRVNGTMRSVAKTNKNLPDEGKALHVIGNLC